MPAYPTTPTAMAYIEASEADDHDVQDAILDRLEASNDWAAVREIISVLQYGETAMKRRAMAELYVELTAELAAAAAVEGK
jgi:hypothetical protein